MVKKPASLRINKVFIKWVLVQKVALERKSKATGKSYARSLMASQFVENNSIKGEVALATLAATGLVSRSLNLVPSLFPLPRERPMVGSGHVAPRFWVVTNKINVADVLKIDSCSLLA